MSTCKNQDGKNSCTLHEVVPSNVFGNAAQMRSFKRGALSEDKEIDVSCHKEPRIKHSLELPQPSHFCINTALSCNAPRFKRARETEAFQCTPSSGTLRLQPSCAPSKRLRICDPKTGTAKLRRGTSESSAFCNSKHAYDHNVSGGATVINPFSYVSATVNGNQTISSISASLNGSTEPLLLSSARNSAVVSPDAPT